MNESSRCIKHVDSASVKRCQHVNRHSKHINIHVYNLAVHFLRVLRTNMFGANLKGIIMLCESTIQTLVAPTPLSAIGLSPPLMTVYPLIGQRIKCIVRWRCTVMWLYGLVT